MQKLNLVWKCTHSILAQPVPLVQVWFTSTGDMPADVTRYREPSRQRNLIQCLRKYGEYNYTAHIQLTQANVVESVGACDLHKCQIPANDHGNNVVAVKRIRVLLHPETSTDTTLVNLIHLIIPVHFANLSYLWLTENRKSYQDFPRHRSPQLCKFGRFRLGMWQIRPSISAMVRKSLYIILHSRESVCRRRLTGTTSSGFLLVTVAQ